MVICEFIKDDKVTTSISWPACTLVLCSTLLRKPPICSKSHFVLPCKAFAFKMSPKNGHMCGLSMMKQLETIFFEIPTLFWPNCVCCEITQGRSLATERFIKGK